MKEWQEVAMKMLPELQSEIIGSETPMSLWVEIPYYFDEAYEEPRNESLIERIYQYADWCLDQDKGETAEEHLPTCVVTCFGEHIPTCKAARDDMPRWFSFEEVMANKYFFEYLLTEEEFEELKEIYSNKENS
jgi:hypothetical protein